MASRLIVSNHLARTPFPTPFDFLLQLESWGPPRTCGDAGGGGSEDFPAVLGHDQQLHLLLGRHIVFLQDQELAVLVQEVLALDIGGTGWGGKKPAGRKEKVSGERRRKKRSGEGGGKKKAEEERD